MDLDRIQSPSVENIVKAVYASSTIPGAFPIKEYGEKLAFDAGHVMHIDPEAAIKRCLEIVQDPKDIVIDMIELGGDGQDVIDGKSPPRQISEFPDGFNEILRVMELYPTVQYRYLIAPSSKEMLNNYHWLE